jgi:hypothetical protein
MLLSFPCSLLLDDHPAPVWVFAHGVLGHPILVGPTDVIIGSRSGVAEITHVPSYTLVFFPFDS